MRTAILVSAFVISDSLKLQDRELSENTISIVSALLLIFIIADVFEFIHNMRKK